MVAEALPEMNARPIRRRRFGAGIGDSIFYGSTLLFASSVLIVCVLIVAMLWSRSAESREHFGMHFLTSSTWDAVRNDYGAVPFIYGTLMSSFLAMLIAVPVGLGTAIFLSELAPRWVRTPVSFLVELLAAVPSVVYGLWGIKVLVPLLRPIEIAISNFAARNPVAHFLKLDILFGGTPMGLGMMAAALVLAIMVLPFITAVSREVILAVPPMQREAAFGLGSTHWEAIRGPILRYARAGIMGAIILGLARALGETMAVTMVIGNSPNISRSLFDPAYTLASVLANHFAEATDKLEVAALLQIALILFCITIIVNSIARLLIWNMARQVRGATRL